MEGQQRVNSMLPDAPTVEIRCDVPVVAMHRLVVQAAARERHEQPPPRGAHPLPTPQSVKAGPVAR
jgi:hypothetical protein